MVLYDDFAGPALDAGKWQVAAVPLGDGNFWFYRDDNADVTIKDGRCRIYIRQFSSRHGQVQIFDNPKQLYLAPKTWSTEGGPAEFSCNMAGHATGDREDYRDGFASFNVLDFASAMVFDIVTNGTRVWAIYERLLIPGVTTEAEAFTEVIDLEVETAPMQEHEFLVSYDRQQNRVGYAVNGVELLVRDDVPVPVDSLTTGFGLITLHPIENGQSVSCRGQGGTLSVGQFYVPS